MAPPKLGDLLVQAGVLTRAQVDQALQHQQSLADRPKLGEVILAMELTTEEVILDVLSHAMHLPAHDLDRSPPELDAVAVVPLNIAKANSVIPVRLETEGRRRWLVLAMSDPTNVQVIDDLQFRTGMVVRPVVTTASQVRRALAHAYSAEEEAPRARAKPRDSGEETPARDNPEATGEEVAELRVVAGPAKGQRYMVPLEGSLDFGRGKHVEVTLPDDRMSRRHFVVVDTGDELELVDLGSTNGTLVNQEVTRRAILKTGDYIEAGDTIIQVSLLAPR